MASVGLEGAGSRQEEEEPDGQHGSQLLPATNFEGGDIEVVKDGDRPQGSSEILAAVLWLIALVILWTMNLVVFKKTSSAPIS